MSDRPFLRLAYNAGSRARDAGYTHLENPHPVGSEDHETWLRGWSGRPDNSVAPQSTTTPTRRDL